ncbi:MAG: LacI family DNA-binding transcriptional regulator [Spirochaetaceae bacterium]|jgi:LacI family transcriptional regulator|nr:LacI family DNA-binding transcriptional regulator [Spirochaetaceae bacterium]
MSVTLKEIAKISGVCRATVDKVIHNRPGVKEKTRRHVLQVLSDLDYKPNIAGKALKMQNSRLTITAVLYKTDAYAQISAGITEQAAQYADFGFFVDIKSVDYPDIEAQAGILEACMPEKTAGVIVTPFNSKRIIDAVRTLTQKGIPVITVNNDLPGDERICFIGQNLRQAGRAAARLMAAFIGGRGTVAVITGSQNFLSDINRFAGFSELLRAEYPDIAIVKTIQNFEDPIITYRETVKLLQEHPGLNGIYITTGRVREVGRAVKTLGFAEKIKIVCFDLYEDIQELVHQRIITCTIGQDLYRQGAYPVQLFFQHFYHNEPLPKGEIFTAIDIRIPENIRYPQSC